MDKRENQDHLEKEETRFSVEYSIMYSNHAILNL